MRVLFIGSTKRGWKALNALSESGASVAGIISLKQHAHETERFEENFRHFAEQRSIPFRESKNLREEDYSTLLKTDWKPDIGLAVGARILFPKSFYEAPRLGMYAVHDSLLPDYRGFAPLHWAIINGEKKTGVTLFQLSEAMDAGAIVAQTAISIEPNETATEVYEKSCRVTEALVKEAFGRITKTGQISTYPQDESLATYTCARSPEDGRIDWSLPTENIYNLVRALSHPFPGAFTTLGTERLTVWKARPVESPRRYVGRIPGKIAAVTPEGFLEVLTGDGTLQIREISFGNEPPELPGNRVKSIRLTLGRADELR